MEEIKIGSHVGMAGKEMFLASVKEAERYGANVLMLYTGAPQNTRRKEIKDLNIEAGWGYATKAGIREIVVHAPYIINLANTVKPETFELALKEILQALSASGIPVLKRSLILDRTGPEAFLCVDADALDVKRLLVPLEDASKLGRLYDIDIIGRDGKKISRSDIGKPGRTCLLCGRPARECSRSRTHSVAELTAAIEKIFKENFAG